MMKAVHARILEADLSLLMNYTEVQFLNGDEKEDGYRYGFRHTHFAPSLPRSGTGEHRCTRLQQCFLYNSWESTLQHYSRMTREGGIQSYWLAEVDPRDRRPFRI
jgi:hypothetical protein